MSSKQRQETPNIMAELMTGKPEPASPKASKPVKQPTGKRPAPPEQSANLHSDAEKVKATFYLSSTGMEALEASWMALRQQAGQARGRVSKSAIVEVALARIRKELKSGQGAMEILGEILRVE